MRILLTLLVLAFLPRIIEAQTVDSTLYSESSFTLHTSGIKSFGTLCVPTKTSRFPVALIVAGSGPTDRDGNNIGGVNCDAYKILAHRLAANNIATLRYDKRGAGEGISALKSESDLLFNDYIDDARDWADSLKKSGRFTEVIVIGHSEGSLVGIVAAIAADKYVSIAGAGSNIGVVLKHQLETIPEPKRDTAYAIIDSLSHGQFVRYVPGGTLRMLFRKTVQPYMISWMKYDPQNEIRKLHIPILIIQGTNDIQVSTDDAKLLSAASPKAKLVLIENMNHLFRIVAGDREANIKTYTEPDLPISDQLVSEVTDFIKKL